MSKVDNSTEHKTEKKSRRLSLKQQGFIRDYLETKNGTLSALKNYDTTSYNVAHAIASENLQKPAIRKEVERLFDESGLKIKDVLKYHKRNIVKDWPTSQTAIKDYYNTIGLTNNQDNNNKAVNIAVLIQGIDK